MTQRANYFDLAPDVMQLLMQQEAQLRQRFNQSSTMTVLTWELVKLRVSQINQCAFCIDMHSKEALALSESSSRLIGLNGWRDMPDYSEVEQVALNWAEKLTIGQRIEDSDYQKTSEVVGEKDLVNLTLAINAINSWNRIAKAFKPEVGSYKAQ